MRLSVLSATTLLLAGAIPAGAADPLTDLLPVRPDAVACFQRSYDAAHLKQHPRQTVRSVLLSLRRENKRPEQIVLRISLEDKRQGDAVLVGGWCAWRQTGANRGEHTRRLVPSFPKEAGVQCQVLPFWSISGEDASLFPADLDASGRRLTLYLRDNVGPWTGTFTPEPPILRLGTDDRVFRLERVDASACAALERAIPEPD